MTESPRNSERREPASASREPVVPSVTSHGACVCAGVHGMDSTQSGHSRLTLATGGQNSELSEGL